jgi:hypothetical protein
MSDQNESVLVIGGLMMDKIRRKWSVESLGRRISCEDTTTGLFSLMAMQGVMQDMVNQDMSTHNDGQVCYLREFRTSEVCCSVATQALLPRPSNSSGKRVRGAGVRVGGLYT